VFINENYLKLQHKLKSDRQVVKVGDDSSGLLLKDNRVYVEQQPSEEQEVATKKYVDDNSGGGASALNDLSDVTYSSGDLTITSLDKIVADDFVVDSGASIELDSHNGNFVAKKAGTEFSAANSAYAGMILGYTCYRNDGGTGDVITIGASMTVLQTAAGNDVKVTFTAPPSGNVELELSALFYGTDKEIYLSLSDAASYNELNQIHTYDMKMIHIDESDWYVNNIKWTLTGLTAGTSYTYYIAAEASTASAYIAFGENRFAEHSPPIIVKAVALPATIVTGG
tara:strand:- start:3637 stop:4485 length:849 start_codon:yes stop_codon:yes gene_type:complete